MHGISDRLEVIMLKKPRPRALELPRVRFREAVMVARRRQATQGRIQVKGPAVWIATASVGTGLSVGLACHINELVVLETLPFGVPRVPTRRVNGNSRQFAGPHLFHREWTLRAGPRPHVALFRGGTVVPAAADRTAMFEQSFLRYGWSGCLEEGWFQRGATCMCVSFQERGTHWFEGIARGCKS